jgi:TRAP-type C4-dicarboxylate transport system permease small subunit|tara:strand:+ start:768 stop:1295 length:528 start_codon:yes stop_codon:yes gene_type:complete
MIKQFENLLNKLRTFERVTIVFLTVSMIGLYGFNVLIREIAPQYASTFAWIDEASRILMVWVVFLTLGLAFDRGRHIAMTSLLALFSLKKFVYVTKAIDLLGIVFSLYCAWLGFEITVFVLNSGQVSPTLNLPMFILYIAPTIGFILLSFRFAFSFLNLTKRFDVIKDSLKNKAI